MAISEELCAARRVELSQGPVHYRDRCIAPDWPLGSHGEPILASCDAFEVYPPPPSSFQMLRGSHPEHTLGAARRFADFSARRCWHGPATTGCSPISLADRLKEVLPQARREIVGDSRTFVAEDQPAHLAGLIDVFIEGTPVIADA